MRRSAMSNAKKYAVSAMLACVPALSVCAAGQQDREPNAAELVQAVRESENWLHRIDSLRLRIEGTWSHPPESIAFRRARLKRQSPDEEPDPQRDWSLKPRFGDSLEYAIDFKRKRLLRVEDEPGRDYSRCIWDGRQATAYSRLNDGYEQYRLDSTTKMFETIFGSLSWPRAQPHSFWWEPTDVGQEMRHFGPAEDFRIAGRADYRGVPCHVLKYEPQSSPKWTHRWYVGVEDHLLYGLVQEANAGAVFEHWMLDYREIAFGCPLPMTQGYTCPEYDPDTKRHFVGVRRDVKVVEAQIDEDLSDTLFQMESKEGIYVMDDRSEPGTSYRYVATAQSVLGKPLAKLAPLGIDPPAGRTDNKPVLLCFFDMSQRPSRHCLAQLVRRAQSLKEQGIFIVAVQAAEIDEGRLTAWLEKQHILFPVGRIEADHKKTRLAWGVRSLPWLILTDESHIVRAEGFTVTELDTRLKGETDVQP
ncbi:MAG: hypothetical protein JW741_08720 [Sedimentisphaerales bacterium]|nr:hypothetical protein [Sedimentisphaerales bacterium]